MSDPIRLRSVPPLKTCSSAAVAGFGPLVVGIVSASYGFPTAIAGLALLYILDIVVLLALIPERRGVDLA